MNYKSKGYAPLNESKRAKDIQVVFLSSRAEKTTKSSNSMFSFEDAAKKVGLKMITIDPSSSTISKGIVLLLEIILTFLFVIFAFLLVMSVIANSRFSSSKILQNIPIAKFPF